MPKQIIFLFGGAIGDALLGVQLQHTLETAKCDSRVVLLSTRKSSFVRQLAEFVPEIEYQELPSGDIRSWVTLLQFSMRPHGVVFLEPFQNPVPTWWKIIARIATLYPGSIEVRYQSRPQSVPTRVRTVAYNPRTDNLFSVIPRATLALIGRAIPSPVPYLTPPHCLTAPARPYILFHFFAGSYRRSFPIEKVRPLLVAARETFPSHEFILTCAHPEEEMARKMADGNADVRVAVSPPARTLLCLLQESSLCVGVASGVTHIAAHLKVPSVVLCNLSDPCWLPSYNPKVPLLYERANCGCHGDKTGECSIETPGGPVYHCLYDIAEVRIVEAMRRMLMP